MTESGRCGAVWNEVLGDLAVPSLEDARLIIRVLDQQQRIVGQQGTCTLPLVARPVGVLISRPFVLQRSG